MERHWQRRYYAMIIFTERKRLEKLNYLDGNPVKRRLVMVFAHHLPLATRHCFYWPWSSFRFYYREDASVLRMDQLS